MMILDLQLLLSMMLGFSGTMLLLLQIRNCGRKMLQKFTGSKKVAFKEWLHNQKLKMCQSVLMHGYHFIMAIWELLFTISKDCNRVKFCISCSRFYERPQKTFSTRLKQQQRSGKFLEKLEFT